MTNLTDKWKAGELGHGAYYVRIEGVILIDFFEATKLKFVRFKESVIDEVLALVPSYEKLQKLESDSLAKKEGEEIIAELENELEKLKEDIRTGRCYLEK